MVTLLGVFDQSTLRKTGIFILLADDTKIFITGRDEDEAYKKEHKVLDEVQQ